MIQSSFIKNVICALFCITILAISVVAQTAEMPRVKSQDARQMDVAQGTNLYCAGYIQTSPMSTSKRIVGSDDEANAGQFSERNFLWMNSGSSDGVRVGDKFSVVRPRGDVRSKWTKKGKLGYYVQELGVVEVIDVKSNASVVRVKNSCENINFGDVLVPFEMRSSARYQDRPALNRFANPTGKATGHIVLAKDNQEMVGREQIVYVDLGADDNLKAGDYLTIFRKLGDGDPHQKILKEQSDSRDRGFESEAYRGGGYSMDSLRKKGDTASGQETTSEGERAKRAKDLRKILGEAVVLNVKEKTATLLITRSLSEIHTGDSVEVQ